MRQLDTKFVRSRASGVLSKARDSTSERLGSRRFLRPFGSYRSYMTSFRYFLRVLLPCTTSPGRRLQLAIFNDLAQEAVSLCRASLLNAADALGAKSAFDWQLFLVRHLLILRDIARSVDPTQKDEPRAGGADAYSMTGGYILALFCTNHPGGY